MVVFVIFFMRNILLCFPLFSLQSPLQRQLFFQGRSYEIKQDALRYESGSVPHLFFLRRDSFKFFLEDKEDFHPRSAKPSSTIKGVLWPNLPPRRFSPSVEPRKLSYSVFQQGEFFVTLDQQAESDSTSMIKESNLNSQNKLSLIFPQISF